MGSQINSAAWEEVLFNTSLKHDCLYDVIKTRRHSLLTYFIKYHRVKTKKACHVCLLSHLVLSNHVVLWTVAHQDPLPWHFPSKNTGMGCYALLQGIFPTRDQTCVSYISCSAGGYFTWLSHWGFMVKPHLCHLRNKLYQTSKYEHVQEC